MNKKRRDHRHTNWKGGAAVHEGAAKNIFLLSKKNSFSLSPFCHPSSSSFPHFLWRKKHKEVKGKNSETKFNAKIMCNSSKTLLFLFWSKVINAWWQKVYGFTATALFHLLGGQWIKQKNEVKSGRVKMLKYLRFEHFILFNYKFLSIFLPKHCRAVMRCAV